MALKSKNNIERKKIGSSNEGTEAAPRCTESKHVEIRLRNQILLAE